MAGLQKNVASQNMTFVLVNATTGAGLTGATVACQVTKDGTAAASAGTLTELKVSGTGVGGYNYAPTQSETNAVDCGFLFTATNAVPVNLDFHTDVVDANGYPSVNTFDLGGTTQTGIDLGTAISNLSSAQLSGLTTLQTSANSISSNLAGLTSAQLSGFATVQTNTNKLSSQLAGLTSAQLSGFATVQINTNALSQNLAGLTSAQLSGFTTVEASTTSILTQATLARQGAINRRETNPSNGVQTLYADDGTTPLKTGNIWLDVGGTQPYDGTGPINRQDGLS